MELMKIANGFQPCTIFPKGFILEIWKGSEYASDESLKINAAFFIITVLRWTRF